VTMEFYEILSNNEHAGFVTTKVLKPAACLEYDFTISESGSKELIIVSESAVIQLQKLPLLKVVIGHGIEELQFGSKKLTRPYRLAADALSPQLNKILAILNEGTRIRGLNGLLFIIQAQLTDAKQLLKYSKAQPRFEAASLRGEKELEGLLFYTLDIADLRVPQRILKAGVFDEKGSNLAAVLRRLLLRRAQGLQGVLFALQQAVAGFDTVEIESVGGYLATKLIYHTDDPAKPRASYLGQESDGTIRMLGLLAALYQEPAQPFISIEEPEANIHPGALAVLAGVLDEASLRSQVLVTTHSPDMLDHLPAESFLVVEKVGDATRVGPLDAGQLESVRRRLFTPGELLRMEGLQRQADNDSAA
jgi:hypothetical protein